MSSTGPRTRRSDRLIGVRRRLPTQSSPAAASAPIRVRRQARASSSCCARREVGQRDRGPRAKPGRGSIAARRPSASSKSSTSRMLAERASCAGRAWPGAASWARTVSAVLIGTPRTRAAAGRAKPIAQYPPSTAGPSTASHDGSPSERERGSMSAGSSLGRVHPDEQRAAAPTVVNAAARRSSRRPGWSAATTSNPGGQPGPGSPSRTSTRRVRTRRRDRLAACQRARPRRSAAAPVGVHGGQRRVFTRPGAGAFAQMTVTTGSSRAPATMSCTARSGAAHRAGHLRATDPRVVGDGDLGDAPARRRRPQHHLQRPAEAPITIPSVEERLSARGAHRPEIGDDDAGASPDELERATRFASRACATAMRPQCRAVAPSTRSASPASTGATTDGRSSTVERRVAVHEAHDVRGRGRAGPRSTRHRIRVCGSNDDGAPRSRATCAVPSVEPLSTTIGWNAAEATQARPGARRLRRGRGGRRRSRRQRNERARGSDTVIALRSAKLPHSLRFAKPCGRAGRLERAPLRCARGVH